VLKAAVFGAELRRNRQVTIPFENINALAVHFSKPTTSFVGCSLQLEIKAIQINGIWKNLSSAEEK